MTETATPTEILSEFDAVLRATPLYGLLGLELLGWAPGSAQFRLATRPDHANLGGAVHGGVLFSLADAAFEVACNGYGRVSVALETSCHYSAPTMVGDVLLADAVEVSRTRRTASYRIELRAQDGELRAWYMALAYRTDRWHLGLERWPESWRAAH